MKWSNIAVIKVKLQQARTRNAGDPGIEIVYPDGTDICYHLPYEVDKFLYELVRLWECGSWDDITLGTAVIELDEDEG